MNYYLLQLSDNEEMIVSEKELNRIEDEDMEFDGFHAHRVVKKMDEKEAIACADEKKLEIKIKILHVNRYWASWLLAHAYTK